MLFRGPQWRLLILIRANNEDYSVTKTQVLPKSYIHLEFTPFTLYDDESIDEFVDPVNAWTYARLAFEVAQPYSSSKQTKRHICANRMWRQSALAIYI
jgi:hypothetical protein